jgi:hypothetical protein
MKDLLASLMAISKLPDKDLGKWLSSAEGSIDFLRRNIRSERMVLFASMPAILIHAVLAPLDALDPPDQKDLSQDFVAPDDKWSIEHVSGGGQADRVYLAAPMSGRWETLGACEKLVFMRSPPWSSERTIEISQKLIHSLDLHFVEERNAYCRLNDDGDREDIINVIEIAGESWPENITVVSIFAKDFTEYMCLSGMGMVVFFDFTRVPPSFNGWSGQEHFEHNARDLFYHGGVMAGHGSYVNGRMIVRPAVTTQEIVEAHKRARDPLRRNYAVFKALDLRTGQRIEVSCSPATVSNYFQQSDLPLEMSPAFFRAEVLHRYKADPEKYELRERSIYCRGTWTLRTYDINDAGQVHTYLRYLGELPHKEQVYWQSFNEWPKAPLSRRAITTDFKGEFFTEYDALNSLKLKIRNLDERRPDWWQVRGDEMAKTVHYPATSASSEWANEMLALDQLTVEGFRVKELRDLAQKLNRGIDKDWKSLKLVEECLVGSGMDANEAKQAMSALQELHEMRSVVKGHSAAEATAT